MADPSKYTQSYDFSEFADANPNSPLPGDRLDNELANIDQSTEELRDAIKDIRRSDGRLKNGIVTRDSLSSNLLALTGADRGAWATATAYVVGDLVTQSSRQYQCIVAHTSSVFATDLAADKWALTAAESAEDAAESAAEAAASAASVPAFSAFWLTIVGAASAAASWLLLLVLGHLTTRTLIKALVPSAGMAVFLSEAGREGTFVWRTGDYSTQVTLDTQEAIYLKADSIAATSGAWVRAYKGAVESTWFGASNLQSAFTFIATVGGALHIPAGEYTLTSALTISSAAEPFRIFGDGRENTKIIRGAGYGSVISVGGSNNWCIEDLSIDGGFSSFSTNANHGIAFSDCSHVRVRRVHVTNWKNSAIIGFVNSPTTDPDYEDCVIDDCSCDGGSAANNGLIIVDMKFSGIRNSNSLNVGKAGSPCYALQVKNGAQDGFIEHCYAENASAGVAFGNNDVVNSLGLRGRLMGINIFNCSVGIALGSNNYIVGSNINIDMNSAGDYGLDFGGSTVGCVFDALRIRRVASGKAAVRFRSGDNENVVRLGVASRAAGSAALIEFLSGAQNNYARIDHVASVTDSSTLVSDAGTGNVFEYSQLPSRQSITIASDAISLRDAKVQDVRIDTESAAATDNLATINNGVDGQQITLSTTSNLRDVTVKHNTGNILLNGAADFTLDANADTLTLRYSGNVTKWCEVGRGNNA